MIQREFTDDVQEMNATAAGSMTSAQFQGGDEEVIQFENKLRPVSLDDYIGQAEIKRNLTITIEASKKRKETLDHVLLHGPAGLGKTSLAMIIAREMGGALKITSGPALERQGDVASMLTNLKEGDVLNIGA